MKRVSKLLAVILLFAVSSCGLNKMVKDASNIKYSVNPTPLEYEAGKIPVSITVNFPPKYFNKKAYLVATPVLVGKDSVTLKPQTLQGESVKDNNPIISYKEGGSFTYKDTIDYVPGLRRSDLKLTMKVSKGANGKELNVATVKIGEGTITTPLLVFNGLAVDNPAYDGKGLMRSIVPTIEKPKATEKKETVVLYYPIQQSRLPYKEQKKEEVKQFLNKFEEFKNDPDVQVLGVDIASYASPDGPIPLNHDLVIGRGNTAENFIGSKLKKEEVNTAELLKRETTPDEDWEGFKNAVQKSNIEDKDLILRVLSMYSDPNVREAEIKKMSAVYDVLRKDILPKLRRSEIQAVYKDREKTTEELISLAKTNPARLSQDELYYAAQEAKGADKEAIYKEYISRYPNDWKAYNNLAVYYIMSGQYDNAETYLNKADELDANNPTVLNNKGVLLFAKGDQEQAKEMFKKASSLAGSNDAIGYNLGVFCILNAKYDDAVGKFGGSDSFNKALAQLLSGNTDAAKKTLENVESQNAYYYYLMAVIEARGDNADGVYTNLQKAVEADASLKAYAKDDLEFRKYFDEDSFKAIVE